MPSSGPEDWERLHHDLSNHERDRESLGYPKDAPSTATPGYSDVPRIPRYEVLARLGEGATAVVYRATDRELGRPVALKVLRQATALNEVARQRFRREAQTSAGLSHPNLVSVYDAGEEGGRLYLVMEFVDGRTLSDLLSEGKTEQREILGLLAKAARGVAAAHEKGIVHRDLKPSNILITASGEPKVADFGLAHLVDSTSQLTRTGSSLGTPLYMSPEQVEGRARDITPRTDVYSLGAVLYEVLTGRPPHSGDTMMEIYQKIVREEPASPQALNSKLSKDLQTVALKALEKDPQRRYPTAGAFADDLGRCLSGEPVLARPVGSAHRLFRRLRGNRVARGLALAAATALLAATGIVVAGREKSRRLETEREKRLTLLRDHARTSLEAVLKLRRAGANAAMKGFVPGLEAAYRQALESAPDAAEVESLMGRMHRALMDDAKALEFQERALRKDPGYAPALYERAVLLANQYGSALAKAVAEARRLPPGPVTAEASRSLPIPAPEEVESRQLDLLAVRESILRDCTALEGILSRGQVRQVGDAHVLTVKGILAFCRLDFPAARTLLEEAVRKDPTLEEAWAALCDAAYRQANLQARTGIDIDRSLRLYEDAEQLYGQAIANDAGYVPHWIGRADTRRHRALHLMWRGKDGLPPLDEADRDLTRALELTQDFPDAWYLRASVRQLAAVCRMDRGEDPSKELDAAEADLRIGLGRWGDRPSSWILKGSLHNERARHRRRRAENPLPDYAAAEEAFRRAVELDPAGVQALTSRGLTRMYRAEYLGARGIDPLPDYAAAEQEFNEVLRRARHTVDPWEKRAQVFMFRATYRVGRGEQPFDDFARADDDFSEALRLSPSNARILAQRASCRGRLGRLHEKLGRVQDAAKSYADALADFKRGFEINELLKSTFGAESSQIEKSFIALPKR